MDNKELKEELIKDLVIKMTDAGNDISVENADKLPFNDIAYVCTVAAIHVLCTFAFTRLSQQGIDDSEDLIEKIIMHFRDSARDAIEDRRLELQGLGDEEETSEPADSKEDPWTEG